MMSDPMFERLQCFRCEGTTFRVAYVFGALTPAVIVRCTGCGAAHSLEQDGTWQRGAYGSHDLDAPQQPQQSQQAAEDQDDGQDGPQDG